MFYGYYPQYYASGQQQDQQVLNHPHQHQFFSPPQGSSYSTNSEEYINNTNVTYATNQTAPPIASNWLNQGTNATTSYNPYTTQQQQAYYPTTYNFTKQQLNQPYTAPYQPETFSSPSSSASSSSSHEKTFTSRSNLSKSQQKQRPASRAQSRTSQILSEVLREDMNQLTPQLEAAYEAATGKRRAPVIKRQVITMPGPAGRVQQVVRRLPTPTPDVIERIFIVRPQRDTINLIIERPSTPPAQYKDRTIYGKMRRPIINPKIVNVTPGNYYYPQLMHNNNSQFQPIQDVNNQNNGGQQMMPVGYLLAPMKYTDGINSDSINQVTDQQLTSTTMQTFTENNAGGSSRAPTFSTNILQPYNPPMLDNMYSQMSYNNNNTNNNYMGYQYPTNFGQQMF
jgi:hypothetical protein